MAATDQLRAGTVGRHSSVDLFLADDEELSLRHLLVLSRRNSNGLRTQIAELATPVGFQAEQGGLLRAVDANGTLVLRAASYSLFFFPTGVAPPWDPDVADPWSTLPPRVLVADARQTPARPVRKVEPRTGDTDVGFREGPSEPGPEPLLQSGERVEGHLVISNGPTEERLAVGPRILDRGIILGRYSRCSGDTTEMSQDVSRVHAVIVQCDGELHVIDADSTNGTFAADHELKCAVVVPGCEYRLGRMKVRWQPTH